MENLIIRYAMCRHTMILSSILVIYFSMLPSESHAYSSYVIVLIGEALATLRATIWDMDSTQLHIHGMAFALAYYLGSLLSTSDMTPDSEVEPDLLKDTVQAWKNHMIITIAESSRTTGVLFQFWTAVRNYSDYLKKFDHRYMMLRRFMKAMNYSVVTRLRDPRNLPSRFHFIHITVLHPVPACSYMSA